MKVSSNPPNKRQEKCERWAFDVACVLTCRFCYTLCSSIPQINRHWMCASALWALIEFQISQWAAFCFARRHVPPSNWYPNEKRRRRQSLPASRAQQFHSAWLTAALTHPPTDWLCELGRAATLPRVESKLLLAVLQSTAEAFGVCRTSRLLATAAAQITPSRQKAKRRASALNFTPTRHSCPSHYSWLHCIEKCDM